MWTTVFFDLDGTLTDSGEGITKSVQYALKKEFGIEVEDPASLRSFVGPPLKEQFMAYTGCDEAQGERAVEAYREYFKPIGIFENRLYPGIQEMLRQLSSEGLSLVLTSSKPEGFCRIILEHFGIDVYFSAIVGSEMDGRRTAKPDVIEEALLRTGMQDRRGEVVMVGDKMHDLIGARACGLDAIGVTYGYGSLEELSGQGAACIVDTPRELRNVLIGQKRAGEKAFAPVGSMGRIATGHKPLFMIWRVVYPLILFYGIQFVFVMALAAVMNGIVYRLVDYETFTQLWDSMVGGLGGTAIADAIVVFVAFICFSIDERQRKARGGGLLEHCGFGPLDCAGTACAAILTSTMVSYMVGWLNVHDAAYEATSEAMYSKTPLPILFLGIVILAPLAEELVMRGLVYRRLRDYAGVPVAVCVSAFLFGAIHGNIVQGIYGFLMGCFMALMYEHFGTIWATVTIHAANNLLALVGNKLTLEGTVLTIYNYVTLGIMCVGLIYMIYLLAQRKRVNVV